MLSKRFHERLSIFQWTQGFGLCVLNEKSFLMQDAFDLGWPTAKRAHAAVLHELERGNYWYIRYA